MIVKSREEALKSSQSHVSKFSKRIEENNCINLSNDFEKEISPEEDNSFTESKTSSSSFNASPSATETRQFVNFEDIENFDIFQDFEPTIIKKQKSQVKAKDHQAKSFSISINQYNTHDNPSPKHSPNKMSLENFESLHALVYVEPNENRPGNYNKYLRKVIKSVKDFDKIDFTQAIEKKAVVLPPTDKKLTLVIDLDETLIHSDFDNERDNKPLKQMQFSHEGEVVSFNLYIRPGLVDFLKFSKEKFEIVIFTASRREYADCILNYLDPENNIFSKRLYREDCISVKNKVFIKDLRIFQNRDIQRILMIDNSFYSFCNQLNNAVLITSYYDSETDNELINLKRYLQNIYDSNTDIRTINEKFFNLEGIKKQILDL